MKKDKIIELDYLRVAAYIAVVIQHVLGYYNKFAIANNGDGAIMGILFGTVKFAVPLFVFLSGMVLFYTYYEHLDYTKFIKKRFLSIYIPYILFSGFYLLFPYKSIMSINLPWVKSFVLHLIYGTGKYHLWYIVMIFQGFILFPIVLFIFKGLESKLKSKSSIWFYGLMLMFGLIYIVYIRYYYDLFTHFENVRINNFFIQMYSKGFLSYVYYFILGAIAARYYEKWVCFLKKNRSIIAAITIIMYVYVEIFAFNNSKSIVELSLFNSLNIRFFIFTVFSILLLYYIGLLLSNYIGQKKLIVYISNYSFWAYLVHPLVLNETNNFLLFYSIKIPVFYTLLTLNTLICSIILGVLLQWIFTTLISIPRYLMNFNT